MSEVFGVFARYGGRYAEEAESVEDAINELRAGNEYGSLFPIGVYDKDTNTAHIPDTEPIGITGSDYRLEDIRRLCGLPPQHTFNEVREFHS